MYIGLHVKYRYSCQVSMQPEFSRQVFERKTKAIKYQISWKSVQWEASCSTRTDRHTTHHTHTPHTHTNTHTHTHTHTHTDMTKLKCRSSQILRTRLKIDNKITIPELSYSKQFLNHCYRGTYEYASHFQTIYRAVLQLRHSRCISVRK